ncbi:hypothetical protein AB0H73_37980 [Streptomyces olivoreticuli]
MAKVWVSNPECWHSWGPRARREHCKTFLEQAADGSWYAKCTALACTTDCGSPVWRAGGRTRPFSYEQLYAMAVQHCRKHHSEK